MNSKLRDLLVDELGVGEELLKPEAHLVTDLGLDSLDLMEVALAIEEDFDIGVSDDELLAWETVADIEKMLKEGQGHE